MKSNPIRLLSRPPLFEVVGVVLFFLLLVIAKIYRGELSAFLFVAGLVFLLNVCVCLSVLVGRRRYVKVSGVLVRGDVGERVKFWQLLMLQPVVEKHEYSYLFSYLGNDYVGKQLSLRPIFFRADAGDERLTTLLACEKPVTIPVFIHRNRRRAVLTLNLDLRSTLILAVLGTSLIVASYLAR